MDPVTVLAVLCGVFAVAVVAYQLGRLRGEDAAWCRAWEAWGDNEREVRS